MDITRRSMLVGAALVVAGCAPDPTVDSPDDAPTRAQPSEAPSQPASFAKVAALLTAVRGHVEAADEGPWRAAALAQCDDQLARLNSLNPFSEPEPVFTPQAASTPDLQHAIDAAVGACVQGARGEEAASTRLLLCSIAAATSGLRKPEVLPGEGTGPSPVETLHDQRYAALTHVWALIHGVEAGLGKVRGDEGLSKALSARLATAKALRDELRAGLRASSQPAAFALPGDMTSNDGVRTAWRTLEVRLLEALVLLAAEEPDDQHWASQVTHAQAVGGRIPRWPGWGQR